MRTVTITVGWTKSEVERDARGRVIAVLYSSFDGYKPGAEQHTETIPLDVPEDLDDSLICELIFRATNDPYAETSPNLAPIAAALHANGYRGQGAHWSLSVGDTVTIRPGRPNGPTAEVEEQMYACENTGWRIVR